MAKVSSDKAMQFIVYAGVLIILGMFFAFGFFIKPTDSTEDKLWGAVHPTTWLDIVGVIMFTISALGLSGISRAIIGEKLMPPKSAWITWTVVAMGALGIVLMFA